MDGSWPYLWGEYKIARGTVFTVALARPTHIGGRTTGSFATTLVDRLRPSSVAMCGVCAGNPAKTALGDVVVGSSVYEWDEGKHSAFGFEGDHQHILLNPRWLRVAQDFDPVDLSSYGEATEDEALLWFLEQLCREQEPRNHPALSRYFPKGTWQSRLARLEEQGWIRREPNGHAVLTTSGSNHVQRRLYDDVEGPQRLPFRVLTAPMASGSAVIADSGEWDRLAAMGVRRITAIEMEGASIATIAHERELPWLVVKGVTDHADSNKDDRYKRFAERASAEVMFALLEQLVARIETDEQCITESADRVKTAAVRTKTPRATRNHEQATSKPTSIERQNAIRSAESYLGITAFSREGLIRQLSDADGYSVETATYAVDSLDIDYNEQAAKSAKGYLGSSAFSRKGLIHQLCSADGYSVESATYAVDFLNVDYNAQAAKMAESYLGFSAFSRDGLIQQLESDSGGGFTHSQAVHGVDSAGL